MVAMFLLWEWPAMAAFLRAGFTMCLKPGDLLSACRCDLSLQSDRLDSAGEAVLSIPALETC
eukprot:1054179-Pyramimonas_sp.AAC.1